MGKRIAIAGDWHGDLPWALAMLALVAEQGIAEVQHLGDFGFDNTPEGETYLQEVDGLCEALNIRVNVTPGNHENYPFIYNEFVNPDAEGFLMSSAFKNISLIPRGHRWVREGVRFVSLGGANSINRYSLTPNVDWWAEESISLGDLYRTVEGGHANVMLAHDCPVSAVPVEDEGEWSAESLSYAQESQVLVEKAVTAVRPDVFFHGHHHRFSDRSREFVDSSGVYSQRIVGLGMNGQRGNTVAFDLSDLSFIDLSSAS